MIEESILNAFLSLMGIILLLGGVLFALKKVAKNKPKNKNSIDLEIMSKLAINAKTHLFVVKAGEKTLLIGTSDHNVTTLSELDNHSVDVPEYVSNDLNILSHALQQKSQKQLSRPQINLAKNPLSFGSFLRSTFKKN